MDKRVIDYLERKMRISRDGDYNRSRSYPNYDRRDYDMDGRRGVRGTGPYGMGRDRRDYDDRDRNYYTDRSDYDYARGDYADRDYAMDRRDYDMRSDYTSMPMHMRLTPEDMHKWKQKMVNADGTRGEHFDAQQIRHIAEKLGIKFDMFDEKEFCLAVNMMYSDYGNVVKKYVSPDKELVVCAELAKAFLKDADGPKPSEKLALYYYCVVDDESI